MHPNTQLGALSKRDIVKSTFQMANFLTQSEFFLNEYYLTDDRIESPNSKTLKMEVGKYYSVEPRRA